MTEAEDTFDSDAVGPVAIDISSIPRGPPGPASDASTLVTALASDVNSVVGRPADAFLRSFTFYRDKPGTEWSIKFADPPENSHRSSSRKSKLSLRGSSRCKVSIGTLSGSAAQSCLRVGDKIKTINGKRIGSSYNAQRAENLMADLIAEAGLLSIICGNSGGDDVLIQATVLKPRPDMTYKEMGIQVWYWGVLKIKSIEKESLFEHTALSSEDHVVSINEILCDRMKEEELFAHVVDSLPDVVTIVAKRYRQRWNGAFI